jgi:hypothetical protein
MDSVYSSTGRDLRILSWYLLDSEAAPVSIVEKITSWLRGRGPVPDTRPIAIVAGEPLPDNSPLVRLTAERLRQREQAAGGWAAEAGGLPVEAYLPEARRLVQRVALGGADGGPPAP